MAGGKLKAVRKTMNFLVQQMSAEDKLSIITFSNEVRMSRYLEVVTRSVLWEPDLAICVTSKTHRHGMLYA